MTIEWIPQEKINLWLSKYEIITKNNTVPKLPEETAYYPIEPIYCKIGNSSDIGQLDE